MLGANGDVWLHCSACRKDILFGAIHWICSVSTCNRNRTRLVFCSVACWDSHVATLRHRDAWAVESRAPSQEDYARHQEDEARVSSSPSSPAPQPSTPRSAGPHPATEQTQRRVTASPAPPTNTGAVTAHSGGPALSSSYERADVLIVVSKMKKYIRDRSGMNTSEAVAEVLGDHVRNICDEAIRVAASHDRKTVLDRDVPKPRR